MSLNISSEENTQVQLKWYASTYFPKKMFSRFCIIAHVYYGVLPLTEMSQCTCQLALRFDIFFLDNMLIQSRYCSYPLWSLTLNTSQCTCQPWYTFPHIFLENTLTRCTIAHANYGASPLTDTGKSQRTYQPQWHDPSYFFIENIQIIASPFTLTMEPRL